MSKNEKEQSALVKSVLALDEYLFELERVGAKIVEMPMKSEFDIEHMRRLMGRFAEYGQGVAQEVQVLSTELLRARSRAEEISKHVSERADIIDERDKGHREKWDRFNALAAKVGGMNTAISSLRRPREEELSEEDRQTLASSLNEFDSLLEPLIKEAEEIRADAHESNIKTLEQNADSLAQTLASVRTKMRQLTPEAFRH